MISDVDSVKKIVKNLKISCSCIFSTEHGQLNMHLFSMLHKKERIKIIEDKQKTFKAGCKRSKYLLKLSK